VTTIRIMTYNVQRCRGGDERFDPDRILRVIGASAPDIAALQDVDVSQNQDQLRYLSERLGMRRYGCSRPGANAFLSYYPLKGVQEYDLSERGCCLRADADISGKRLHLFNLRLEGTSGRRRQIAKLLGPELLGNDSLICPTLVLGDFADLWWGAGNMSLTKELRKVRRPLYSATYPARFPLSSRDRAYVRGEIRILDSVIERTPLARQASSHLPLILTVQVADPRTYLGVKKINHNRMEIAPG
jgi:endonuclease/exonuclease/phosphatase family metal-dependent hydrolase